MRQKIPGLQAKEEKQELIAIEPPLLEATEEKQQTKQCTLIAIENPRPGSQKKKNNKYT